MDIDTFEVYARERKGYWNGEDIKETKEKR